MEVSPKLFVGLLAEASWWWSVAD